MGASVTWRTITFRRKTKFDDESINMNENDSNNEYLSLNDNEFAADINSDSDDVTCNDIKEVTNLDYKVGLYQAEARR